MRLYQVIPFLLLIGFLKLVSASQFYCPKGDPIIADLGDSVIMRTCMWQKTQNVVVRFGPLELIKDGVLILQTQTNSKGKLHGPFISWNDDGDLLEEGNYIEGLKEGSWIKIKENGYKEIIHYKGGIPIEP